MTLTDPSERCAGITQTIQNKNQMCQTENSDFWTVFQWILFSSRH